MDLNKARKILRIDCTEPLSDEVVDLFYNNCDFVTFKKKEEVIKLGESNPYLFVIVSGIIRVVGFEGENEVTFSFAGPGTFLLSPYFYCFNKPAFLFWETCSPCDMLRIPITRVKELIKESHEFSNWLLNMTMNQYYAIELRLQMLSGSTKENYISLMQGKAKNIYYEFSKIHPDIIKSVPLKVLASYLKVNPTYLSRVRREVLEDLKKRNG